MLPEQVPTLPPLFMWILWTRRCMQWKVNRLTWVSWHQIWVAIRWWKGQSGPTLPRVERPLSLNLQFRVRFRSEQVHRYFHFWNELKLAHDIKSIDSIIREVMCEYKRPRLVVIGQRTESRPFTMFKLGRRNHERPSSSSSFTWRTPQSTFVKGSRRNTYRNYMLGKLVTNIRS